MSFSHLGLSAPILKAVTEQGYDTPTPIQEGAIPAVIEGQDVMAAAQTGTGKTAGFTLPILEKLSSGQRAKSNHVSALILTPTRELAAQIQDNVAKYSKYLPLTSNVVFGGVKINPQMMNLRKGSDILVATPGRLMDLHQQNAVKFSQVEILVLDEADRMLDMGFIRDIRKILNLLPRQRQNLLFSATFSPDIVELAKGLVNNPVEISVNPTNSTAKTVEQSIYPTDQRKKAPMLAKLIQEGNWHQVLVFCRTKHGANRLAKYLTEQDISAAAIHGNKSQGARTRALAEFKSNDIRVLVATDIAARGIDIPQLPQVVNFDLPNVAEDYVHRIGRTGRAGEVGKAFSLVCADEAAELFAIERLIQQVLDRRELEGYPVTNTLPESRLDTRPIKPKKPKKPKKHNHADGQRSSDNARGHKPVGKNRRHINNGNNGNNGNNTGGNSNGSNSGNNEASSTARKPAKRKPQQASGQNNTSGDKTNQKPASRRPRRPSNKPASRD